MGGNMSKLWILAIVSGILLFSGRATFAQDSHLLGTANMAVNTAGLMGSWSGNGGGSVATKNNIWFLGEETVDYCILRSEEYPLSMVDLQLMVRNGFAKWMQFFSEHGLKWKFFHDEKLGFLDGKSRRMATEFNETVCENPEEAVANKKLVFLFGLANPVVNLYRQMNDESQLGIAIRPTYDHRTYRNGGYVWLAESDSFEPPIIEHVLLHELGHIFGMPHDSVFVMSRNISLYIQHRHTFQDNLFGHIETKNWPFFLRPGESVELTSQKNFKEVSLPFLPIFKRCGADYMPAAAVPAEVLTAFRILKDDCVKISLKKLASEGGGPSFQLFIKTKIHPLDLRLKGRFEPKSMSPFESNMGPTLTSFWQAEVDQKKQAVWGQVPLAKELHTMPLFGNFHGSGRSFPANIFQIQGVSVEIYIAHRRYWWTLTTRLRSWEKANEPKKGWLSSRFPRR